MDKVRVLVIQENRLLRDEMVAKLKKYANLKVIGEDGASLQLLAGRCRRAPDVILLDPEVGIVRQVKELYPDSRLAVTDVDTARADMLALIGAGVCGFITRNATCATLVNTAKSIASRKPVIPLELMERLAAQLNDIDHLKSDAVAIISNPLTRRQVAIAELITEGMSNQEIANHCQVSIYTVKSHVHSILEKLSLKSRLQISAYMRANPTLLATSKQSEVPRQTGNQGEERLAGELPQGLSQSQVMRPLAPVISHESRLGS